MKKKTFKCLLCFMTAVILLAECNSGTFVAFAAESGEKKSVVLDFSETKEVEEEDLEKEAEEEETADKILANSYLYPFEEAVGELEKIAEEQEIPAVVYLEDFIYLRSLPEESSEPVKKLLSGDSVRILGAGQDAEHNVWYRVLYKNEMEEVSGYVYGENIACVDSRFTEWKETYVRSISVISMYGLDETEGKYIDIEKFPSSYQSSLNSLKKKHPNWIFVPMNTNLDWSKSVKSQVGDRSLIHSDLAECWKNGMHSPGWAYASEAAIKYYMDPRNWLTESNIFQFEMLGFDSTYQTLDMVERIVAGTFMANQTIENGKTYAQTFVELAKSTNVSPILQAARVRQEQGISGSSALISGTYAGYEGYYNYYNIKASGKTNAEVIENGLKYAREKGWNSRYKALVGGAQFLGNDYIRVGQDTLYLQKFDLIGPSFYSHQYMQNIKAPYSEALSVYNAYNKAGLLNQAFIFRIPVYSNMPAKKAAEPGNEDKITLTTTSITNLQIDGEVTLTPLVNGNAAEGITWLFASSNPEVATVDNNGLVKGIKTGETTITCKNADDPDNPNVGTCKIIVVKAEIDESKLEKPKLEEMTYNPAITLKDIVLPEGYTWVNPDMVPTAAQTEYAVIYSPNEEKYNSITFNLSINVKRKTLTVNECTIPVDLEGGAGNELSTINLPKGFYWNDPQEKLPNKLGNYEYKASYNPDSTNYETLTDIKISVKVICDVHNFGEWTVTEASCETDGSKIRKCIVCGKEEKLVLEKTGHSYENKITKEPTEKEEGVRTFSCKNCGDTYTESIPKLQPAHVHKYVESVVKTPSCTESGQKKFECACGDSYTETVNASGHKMEKGRCQLCGYTDTAETPEEEKNNNGNAGSGNNGNQNPSNGSSTNNSNTNGNGNSENSSNTNNSGTTGNGNSGNNTTNSNNTGTAGTENNSNSENANKENTTDSNKNPLPENSALAGSSNKDDSSQKKDEEGTEDKETIDKEKQNDTVSENVNPTKPAEKPDASAVKTEVDLMTGLLENAENKANSDENRQSVSIQLNKNTEISQTIVEMAKKQGVNLELALSNNLKWIIQTDSLSDGMPSAVNMNAQIVQDVVAKEVINEVIDENDYMELSLSHDGEFGFGATLVVPVEEKYVGQMANLFYFNETTKKLEFQMASPVDEEGNIQLEFVHASDYVIVFAEESLEAKVNAEEKNDETAEEIIVEEALETKEKKSTGKLLIVCMIIMVLAGTLAGVGYFICLGKKEIPTEPDFEEWLKEESKAEEKTSENVKKAESKTEKDEYLDDDVDDYREKDMEKEKPENLKKKETREEIYPKEDTEEYLDDDVDDYREKI